MAMVEKSALTTSKEWWDHLWWTKRAFLKAERRASKTVAVEDAAERAKRRNEPDFHRRGDRHPRRRGGSASCRTADKGADCNPGVRRGRDSTRARGGC